MATLDESLSQGGGVIADDGPRFLRQLVLASVAFDKAEGGPPRANQWAELEGDGMLVAVSICPAGTDMIPCRRVSGVVVVLLFLPR